MIKKNKPLALIKDGTMRQVFYHLLNCPESNRREIAMGLGLPQGKVASALYNLVFCGMVVKVRTPAGFKYVPAGHVKDEITVSSSLRGVSSIFNVR